MGTDIHFAVEFRKDEESEWKSAHKLVPYVDGNGEADNDYLVPDGGEWYEGRNYGLFAILANVRNGSGFAGVDTGDEVVPICNGRGLPEDLTSNVTEMIVEHGYHDHGYATLQELIEYDWTRSVKQRGVVSASQYLKWWCGGSKFARKAKGLAPESYSGGVGGRDIVFLSEEEMQTFLKGVIGTEESRHRQMDLLKEKHPEEGDGSGWCIGKRYVNVEWTEIYYQMTDVFWSTVMPRLFALGKPENVRIVFSFDS